MNKMNESNQDTRLPKQTISNAETTTNNTQKKDNEKCREAKIIN